MIAGEDWVQLVRARDYDRFLCIQLAPAPARAALYAVTAFHAELARIAETVSEPLLGHIRLAWWREAIDEILAHRTPRNHPVVLALNAALAQHPQVAPLLYRAIEARAADLDESLIADEAAWVDYCDGTAGALHGAWAMLLDAQHAHTRGDIIVQQARGYAFIGLARAIPYMAQQGFLRFPHGRLNRHGITALQPGNAVAAFTKELIDTARDLLVGDTGPKPLRGLAALARLHANQLSQVGHDPFHLRPRRFAAAWQVLRINITKNS